MELAHWQAISASERSADFRDFLQKFPQGEFAGLARAKLAAFEEMRWEQVKDAKDASPFEVFLAEFPGGAHADGARAAVAAILQKQKQAAESKAEAEHQARERVKAEVQKQAGAQQAKEASAWAAPPIGLKDVIYDLSARYAIYDTSAAGDTLEHMMSRLDAIEALIAEKKPHGFLFSGGGNDIAGEELEHYLKPGATAASPADYIGVGFRSFERRIEEAYHTMFDQLTGKFPDLKIFCHNYDWARPQPGGQWLWPAMEKKQIPVEVRADVIKIMIDRFSAVLHRLAALYPGRVIHVDCRGVVGADEWHDELHPVSAGFERVARRFQEAIDSNLTAAG